MHRSKCIDSQLQTWWVCWSDKRLNTSKFIASTYFCNCRKGFCYISCLPLWPYIITTYCCWFRAQAISSKFRRTVHVYPNQIKYIRSAGLKDVNTPSSNDINISRTLVLHWLLCGQNRLHWLSRAGIGLSHVYLSHTRHQQNANIPVCIVLNPL